MYNCLLSLVQNKMLQKISPDNSFSLHGIPSSLQYCSETHKLLCRNLAMIITIILNCRENLPPISRDKEGVLLPVQVSCPVDNSTFAKIKIKIKIKIKRVFCYPSE